MESDENEEAMEEMWVVKEEEVEVEKEPFSCEIARITVDEYLEFAAMETFGAVVDVRSEEEYGHDHS